MSKRMAAVMFLILVAGTAMARDWFVSPSGSGKKGTKEAPANDLGNIASQLKAGDVVNIAAGTYLGKGDNGADAITVPVSIVGGWKADFSARDPWGAHKTVFSGAVMTKNWDGGPRLLIDLSKYREKEMPAIVVDGIIVDRGAQNHYATAENLKIVRLASPKTGANPTPDSGGIVIRASTTSNPEGAWDISVRNCIVMNAAPTQGALAVFAYAGSKVRISNNLVINCTGVGIYAGSLWKGSEEARAPAFEIQDNSVLFIWKYDPYVQSFSGMGFDCDAEALVSLRRNIFSFSDRIGVSKKGSWPILLEDNVIAYSVGADYYEAITDTLMDLADALDEGEAIHSDSGGNRAADIALPLSRQWLERYGQRVLIDRNAAEADLGAQRTRANALRAALGLAQRADDLKADSPIWLHRLSLDDALAACAARPLPGRGAGKELVK